ncbi:MAG: hypothetical protein ABJC12_10205, partial [Saprospiraceae bacterium]
QLLKEIEELKSEKSKDKAEGKRKEKVILFQQRLLSKDAKQLIEFHVRMRSCPKQYILSELINTFPSYQSLIFHQDPNAGFHTVPLVSMSAIFIFISGALIFKPIIPAFRTKITGFEIFKYQDSLRSCS